MKIDFDELEIVSQEDLRIAQYELSLLSDKEADPKKKQSLKNVEDAIWQATNHYGKLAIASREIMEVYK